MKNVTDLMAGRTCRNAAPIGAYPYAQDGFSAASMAWLISRYKGHQERMLTSRFLLQSFE